ncbi:MAG: zinc-ribbon domain-containing protein [Burkholderiaceae bacterium]|nr:zinc-ribbon domain-containing protein [Burkholderiaceae bacterium]
MGLLDRLFGTRADHHGRHGRGHGSSPPPTVAAICPGCTSRIASTVRFCPRCGVSVMPMACTHCGASQPAGARFCGQCGKPSQP